MDANSGTRQPRGKPDQPDQLDRHSVVIRRVESLDEYDECVLMQSETWGEQFTEHVPVTILRVSQEVGGVTAAAFAPGGRMLGFVFGISGVRNGQPAHWSDMLAIRPEAQGLGIGTRLKYYQRELLLRIGVRMMYWTYDPLVARNAHFNLMRLGARVAEYKVNYYGEDTRSIVHAGLGTDRFIVAWDLTRAPDAALPPFEPSPDATIINTVDPRTGMPTIQRLPEVPVVRVAIPGDIFSVLSSEPVVAKAWRDTTRCAFEHYLGNGYRVVAFQRDGVDGYGTYYLHQPELHQSET